MEIANLIDRRKALTVVATLPVAVALSGVPAFASGQPGELAALVQRYFAEVDVFNSSGEEDDAAADRLAAATFDQTLQKMIGVPARSRADALAAIEWLIAEGKHSMIEFSEYSLYSRVSKSLTAYLG
jgi:hypothetical protein